jgi:hypothetical protein
MGSVDLIYSRVRLKIIFEYVGRSRFQVLYSLRIIIFTKHYKYINFLNS